MSDQQPFQHSFVRSLRNLQMAFWQRRVIRWIIRAMWLSLLVPTIFLAGYLWYGWQISWMYWLLLMFLVGVLSLLWPMRPIRLKRMVQRLDRRMELRNRLITSFEVSQQPRGDNQVVDRLLEEVTETNIRMRRRVRLLNSALWLEIQALVAVSALLGGLLVLEALTVHIPEAEPVDLSPPWQEPRAEEVIPPNPQLFPPPFMPEEMQVLDEQQIQAALEALADALRDQAATRSVAEALDRGDLAAASEALRRLADQLGSLSDEARSELGEALGEAAEGMGGEIPDLTDPLQRGERGLGQGDLAQAGQALEDLAEALDALGEAPTEVADNGESADEEAGSPTDEGEDSDSAEENQGDEESEEANAGTGEGEAEAADAEGSEQPSEMERLGNEGEPLSLESEEPEEDPEDLENLEESVSDSTTELDAEGDEMTEDSPFARQTSNSSVQDLGPDSLAYPWEKRDVVRRYFTP